MKIGIVGSRRRDSEADKAILREYLKAELVLMLARNEPIILISGGCNAGGDRFAEELSKELGLTIKIFYPDKSGLPVNPSYWDHVKMFYARNTLIAEACDVLVCLRASDKKGGTENTRSTAKKLGKLVVDL